MHFPGLLLVECFVSYPQKKKQKSLALLSKTKKTLVSNLPGLNCCQNQAKHISNVDCCLFSVSRSFFNRYWHKWVSIGTEKRFSIKTFRPPGVKIPGGILPPTLGILIPGGQDTPAGVSCPHPEHFKY